MKCCVFFFFFKFNHCRCTNDYTWLIFLFPVKISAVCGWISNFCPIGWSPNRNLFHDFLPGRSVCKQLTTFHPHCNIPSLGPKNDIAFQTTQKIRSIPACLFEDVLPILHLHFFRFYRKLLLHAKAMLLYLLTYKMSAQLETYILVKW